MASQCDVSQEFVKATEFKETYILYIYSINRYAHTRIAYMQYGTADIA